MNSTVHQLPAPRAPQNVLELERRFVGGLLHLAPPAPVLAAVAVIGSDFSVELYAKVVNACRRQAEAGLKYSHETVTAAGLRRGALTVDEARQLEQLAGSNTLTLDSWRHLAGEYKRLRTGIRTALALETEAARIRRGEFNESVTAGRLSALERELQRGAARIEDLTGDQERLLARWDRHRAEKTFDYVPTGLKALDAEIGGWPRKGLSLVTADAGVGKTAVIDSSVHAMLMLPPRTISIGMISPENGVEHLPKRWLARETGWLLREIGSRELSPEEETKLQEIAAVNHELLKRVHGFRERNVTADHLIALCWQLVELGCGAVFIDNFNKIRLTGRADYHERVQDFSDRLSEFSERAEVPAILVVHQSDSDVNNTRGKQVSGSGGLQGGKSLGRDARLRLDLFRKDRELRGLIAKANELGEQGTVIQFNRQATAGLIDPDTGERIDVAQERAIERRRKSEEQQAERDAVAKKRRATRAAEKAEEDAKDAAAKAAAEPPAQARLIDVPTTEKPDAKTE